MNENSNRGGGGGGPTFFSLGYRCSSAGLLKRMGIKHESFPFDWMVSRLPIILDCIRDNFSQFMNISNYKHAVAATWHYVTMGRQDGQDGEYIKKQISVCDEDFFYNTYYESSAIPAELKQIMVPYPVSVPKDAYGYNLIMNHKNVVTTDGREYYQRCILRWNSLMASSCEKIGIYIHPVISQVSYDKQNLKIRHLITYFHKELRGITSGYRGIYIIPIRWVDSGKSSYQGRGDYDEHLLVSPPAVPSVIRIAGISPKTVGAEEMIYVHDQIPEMYIFAFYVREDFIDAGEIFMGNSDKEVNMFANLVKMVGNKETIPYSVMMSL